MVFNAEEHKKYIGGSDAAAILGLSRWRTSLSVWGEKTGQIEPDDISDKLYIKLGNKLEPAVCELFTEETGLKVRRVNETIFHKKYPFLGANIDRKIEGQDIILEAKTCSPFKAKEWEGDEMPQEYILQCYHYLAVTGYKKAYLAVLIGNHDFKVKEIPYDKKVIDDLVAKEVAFWNNYVLPKVMPAIITKNDDDVLYKLYPLAEEGKVVELGDDVNLIIEQLESYKADASVVKGNIDRLKNELKAKIKEGEIGKTNLWQIKWGNVKKKEFVVKAQEYRELRYKKSEQWVVYVR